MKCLPFYLSLFLWSCTPKNPAPQGINRPIPPTSAVASGGPMMAAYTADGPNNIVIHVADVALDSEKTGWNGDYNLLQDVQVKTLDDGFGLFSRVELVLSPELEQYRYGLHGSADHVWFELQAGEQQLALTLHIKPLINANSTTPAEQPDPGPPLNLDYSYVTVDTLLQQLEQQAGIWTYFAEGIELPTLILSARGSELGWRDVAGLIQTTLRENGYALQVEGLSLLLQQSDSADNTWVAPPWAQGDDGRPPAPGNEEPEGDDTEVPIEERTE